jgi:hypothetical protein
MRQRVAQPCQYGSSPPRLVKLQLPAIMCFAPEERMSESLLIDALQWAGFTLGLLGNWLVGKRDERAFLVWAFSNILVVWINVHAGLYVMAGLFAIYLVFCIHNYLHWKRAPLTMNLTPDEAELVASYRRSRGIKRERNSILTPSVRRTLG